MQSWTHSRSDPQICHALTLGRVKVMDETRRVLLILHDNNRGSNCPILMSWDKARDLTHSQVPDKYGILDKEKKHWMKHGLSGIKHFIHQIWYIVIFQPQAGINGLKTSWPYDYCLTTGQHAALQATLFGRHNLDKTTLLIIPISDLD
jgi:hypothetical protein